MTNLQKISILCATVLTMGLTACGETAENSDSKDNTAVTTTTTAAETTTTAAPADDSAEDVESEVETESAVEEETESKATDSSENEQITESIEDKEPKAKIHKETVYFNGNLEAYYEYNELGNLIKKEFYSDSSLSSSYSYKYDEKGNATEEICTEKDGSVLTTRMEYDEHDNIVVSAHDNDTVYYEYDYDDNNRIIKEIKSFSNNTNKFLTFYEYKDETWIKTEEGYTGDDLIYRLETVYDMNDNEISMNNYGYFDNSSSSMTFENIYDSNNNLTEKYLVTISDSSSDNSNFDKTLVVENKYDDDNNLIEYTELTYNSKGISNPTYHYIMEYNENRDVINEISEIYDGDTLFSSDTRKYDYEYYD
ncbi:hypothetical protein [uncultured Ruminococcus sp.]|uniref:hypothetical protein n=1 Tax=uncultured Ruminococcus sp. TaxID=165186 RepID=UPI0025F17FF0|nr:hypothetical protein [uncultured Ruminococcus sp.]